MKTIEERATFCANTIYTQYHDSRMAVGVNYGYKRGAEEQKKIDRKFLVEIYDLYSALIDDLYCGYRLSDYNGGVVDVFEETMSMGEALDKLNALFNKALYPKSTEE